MVASTEWISWSAIGLLQLGCAVAARCRYGRIVLPTVFAGQFAVFTFPKIFCLIAVGSLPEPEGFVPLEALAVAISTVLIAVVYFPGVRGIPAVDWNRWPRLSFVGSYAAFVLAILPCYFSLGGGNALFMMIQLPAVILLLNSPGPFRGFSEAALLALLVHLVAHFLIGGSLWFGVLLAVAVFVRWQGRPTVRHLVSVAVVVLFLGLLQWGKPEFRALVSKRDVAAWGRPAKWLDITLQKWKDAEALGNAPDYEMISQPLGGKRFSSAFLRAGDNSLARVLAKTPSEVPYGLGWSYEPLARIFMPRILFPDKPVVQIWHEFGHRYGYLEPSDRVTSVAFHFLSEGYFNFGRTGLIVVAISFAFLMVGAERVCAKSTSLAPAFLTSWVACLLGSPKEGFSIVTGFLGMMTLCVLVIAALRIGKLKRRSDTEGGPVSPYGENTQTQIPAAP